MPLWSRHTARPIPQPSDSIEVVLQSKEIIYEFKICSVKLSTFIK